MSSILKALKKIESSAPPEESLNPAQVFNPRAVFGQRHRGRRLTSKTIWIGLAAVVVLAAGILFQGWMSETTGPRGDKPLTAAVDNAPAGANAFHAKLPDVKTAIPSPPVAAQPLPGQAASVAAPAPLPAAAPEAPAAHKPAPPAAKPAARLLPKDRPPAPATERPSTLAQKAASRPENRGPRAAAGGPDCGGQPQPPGQLQVEGDGHCLAGGCHATHCDHQRPHRQGGRIGGRVHHHPDPQRRCDRERRFPIVAS